MHEGARAAAWKGVVVGCHSLFQPKMNLENTLFCKHQLLGINSSEWYSLHVKWKGSDWILSFMRFYCIAKVRAPEMNNTQTFKAWGRGKQQWLCLCGIQLTRRVQKSGYSLQAREVRWNPSVDCQYWFSDEKQRRQCRMCCWCNDRIRNRHILSKCPSLSWRRFCTTSLLWQRRTLCRRSLSFGRVRTCCMRCWRRNISRECWLRQRLEWTFFWTRSEMTVLWSSFASLFQHNHSKNSNIQRGVRLFSTMNSRISLSPGSSMRGVSSLRLVRFQWIPHFRRSFHYGCPPQASFSLPACAVHSTIDGIATSGLLQAAVWLGTPYRFPPLLAFVSHIQAGTSWVCYP